MCSTMRASALQEWKMCGSLTQIECLLTHVLQNLLLYIPHLHYLNVLSITTYWHSYVCVFHVMAMSYVAAQDP